MARILSTPLRVTKDTATGRSGWMYEAATQTGRFIASGDRYAGCYAVAGITQHEAEQIARDLEALEHCSDQTALACISRVALGNLAAAH